MRMCNHTLTFQLKAKPKVLCTISRVCGFQKTICSCISLPPAVTFKCSKCRKSESTFANCFFLLCTNRNVRKFVFVYLAANLRRNLLNYVLSVELRTLRVSWSLSFFFFSVLKKIQNMQECG